MIIQLLVMILTINIYDVCQGTWNVPFDNDGRAGRLVPGTRPRHHSQTRFPGLLALNTKIIAFFITIVRISSTTMTTINAITKIMFL